jgi:hypothetical protein
MPHSSKATRKERRGERTAKTRDSKRHRQQKTTRRRDSKHTKTKHTKTKHSKHRHAQRSKGKQAKKETRHGKAQPVSMADRVAAVFGSPRASSRKHATPSRQRATVTAAADANGWGLDTDADLVPSQPVQTGPTLAERVWAQLRSYVTLGPRQNDEVEQERGVAPAEDSDEDTNASDDNDNDNDRNDLLAPIARALLSIGAPPAQKSETDIETSLDLDSTATDHNTSGTALAAEAAGAYTSPVVATDLAVPLPPPLTEAASRDPTHQFQPMEDNGDGSLYAAMAAVLNERVMTLGASHPLVTADSLRQDVATQVLLMDDDQFSQALHRLKTQSSSSDAVWSQVLTDQVAQRSITADEGRVRAAEAISNSSGKLHTGDAFDLDVLAQRYNIGYLMVSSQPGAMMRCAVPGVATAPTAAQAVLHDMTHYCVLQRRAPGRYARVALLNVDSGKARSVWSCETLPDMLRELYQNGGCRATCQGLTTTSPQSH